MSMSNTCRSCKCSFKSSYFTCPTCGTTLDCGADDGLSQMDVRKLKVVKPLMTDEEWEISKQRALRFARELAAKRDTKTKGII